MSGSTTLTTRLLSAETKAAVRDTHGFYSRFHIPHHFTVNPTSTEGMGSAQAAAVRFVQRLHGIPLFRELTTILVAAETRTGMVHDLLCYDAMNSYDQEKVEKALGGPLIKLPQDGSIKGLVHPARLQYGDRKISRVIFDQSIADTRQRDFDIRRMCTNAGTLDVTVEFAPVFYSKNVYGDAIVSSTDIIDDKTRFYAPEPANVVILSGPPGLTATVMENRIEQLFLARLTKAILGSGAVQPKDRAAGAIQELRPLITTKTISGLDAIWDHAEILDQIPDLQTAGYEVPPDVKQSLIDEVKKHYEELLEKKGPKILIVSDNYLATIAKDIRKACMVDETFSHVELFFCRMSSRNTSRPIRKKQKMLRLSRPISYCPLMEISLTNSRMSFFPMKSKKRSSPTFAIN